MHHAFKLGDAEHNVEISRSASAYRLHFGGQEVGVDLKTGAVVYGPERLPPGTYSGSPVLADGHIYVTNEEGLTSVYKAGAKFEMQELLTVLSVPHVGQVHLYYLAGLKHRTQALADWARAFVREEIHHVREGKHGARSTKQAIAIGLSKARRAGVPLPPPKRGRTSERTRESAERAYEVGQGKRKPRATSAKRSRAVKKALQMGLVDEMVHPAILRQIAVRRARELGNGERKRTVRGATRDGAT